MYTTDTTQNQIEVARGNLSMLVNDEANRVARELGFRWTPTPEAPTTFDHLVRAFNTSVMTKVALPISSTFSADTIYRTTAVNVAGRFWHDTTHVTLNKNFSLDDEFWVAEHQLADAKRAGFQEQSIEYQLLYADTIGQNFCLGMLGRFPISQRRFAIWCLHHDLETAVELEREAE